MMGNPVGFFLLVFIVFWSSMMGFVKCFVALGVVLEIDIEIIVDLLVWTKPSAWDSMFGLL